MVPSKKQGESGFQLEVLVHEFFFLPFFRKKVGGPEKAAEYEAMLVQWIDEQFETVKVTCSKLTTI
jgi:hypothetical protein